MFGSMRLLLRSAFLCLAATSASVHKLQDSTLLPSTVYTSFEQLFPAQTMPSRFQPVRTPATFSFPGSK